MASSSAKLKSFRLISVGAVLSFICFFSLSALERSQMYPFPEDPLKGSKLFISKGCVKCHSIWGIGDALGPDLAQISKEQNLLQLAGLLWSHSPKMIDIMHERGVSRPNFTPQEMGDLMGYIYFFNYFDLPGNYTEGEKLFSEKGCVKCHSIGNKEGKKKIPLDRYGRYISPAFIATGLWNHGSEILSEMNRLGLKQPEFKGQELSHLMAYIRGASFNPEGEIIYAEPGSPMKGKEIFEKKNCDTCHSVWGKGGKRATDLGQRELRLSLTEITGRIWSHTEQMFREIKKISLPFPTFTTKEMADLISYLYFIQFYDEIGNPVEGKILFRERACIFCHALEGEGENVGPDLGESEAHFSPIFLASAMWNHAVVMEDMLKEKDLPWPRFSGNEMRDLVSYIQEATQKARDEKKREGILPEKSKVLFISQDKFDSELAQKGKKIYGVKACSACHTLKGEKSAIMGGDLKDVVKSRDLEWLFRFIKDPKAMMKTDGLAKQLLKEFNDIPMPQQGLTDEEVIAIIEYLKAPEKIQ